MQNKKILLITLRGDIGGGPRHVDSLYQNFKKEFKLFIAAPIENPFGIKWYNQLSESNNFLKLPHRKFLIRDFINLVLFVKSHNINIIHAHGRGAGIYARLLKLFTPQINILYTWHGFHIESFSFWKKQIAIFIERILSPLTTLFINISENERDVCIKHKIYKKNKSVVIYNGVRNTLSEKYDISLIREKLGLPLDKFIIICVTRFDPIKNVKDFIEVANLLKSQDDILFVLLGDGEDSDKVKLLINKYSLKNILLTGFINNPIDYIMSSDIYLTTALIEGLPYSLIEAIMCGKPIIASNVRGNNEIVVDQENGFLFELSDLSQAAKKIIEIKNDVGLYSLLSTNARKRYLHFFTEDRMIMQIQSLYKRF